MKWLLSGFFGSAPVPPGGPGRWHKRWQCPECFFSVAANFTTNSQWAKDLVCQGCGNPFDKWTWLKITARRRDTSKRGEREDWGERGELFEFGKIIPVSDKCRFCGTSYRNDEIKNCPQCGAKR